MSASESGLFTLQALNDLGAPLIAGRLYTYAYGTTTHKTAYADAAGLIPQTYTSDGMGGQYIAMDARGELPAPLYLTPGSYDIALKTAAGATIWTRRADPTADIAAGIYTTLSTSSGSSLVGYQQGASGSVLRTVQNRLRDRISVKDFGAVGDGVTDDYVAIRAAVTAAENAELFWPPGVYCCSQTVILTDGAGHDFQGAMIGHNATVKFTFTGSAAAADKDMDSGFAAFPKSIAFGGDISGMKHTRFSGLTFDGPANGTAFRMANSQECTIEDCTMQNARYGIVMECCINIRVQDCFILENKNAGVGLLILQDVARVYYGSFGGPGFANDFPLATAWNDSPNISHSLFAGGAMAGILDHGSNAEGIRLIENCIFYSDPWPGTMQYGYVGRSAQPTFENCWWENVNFPICALNTDESRGGSSKTLAARPTVQPGGTYPLSLIRNGYSNHMRVHGCYFANCACDIDLGGVTVGSSSVGQNTSQGPGRGGRIGAFLVQNYGSGYSAGTVATVTGGGGSGAVVYPAISGGSITGIIVLNPGQNYTGPEVVFADSGVVPGSGARARVTIAAGVITAVTMIEGGQGYNTGTTTATITGGGGSGCTLTVTVLYGTITKVTVTAGGTLYTEPTITLSATGGGSGATFAPVALGCHLYSADAGSQWIVDSGDAVVVPASPSNFRYKALRYEQYTKLNTEMGQRFNQVGNAAELAACITSSAGTLTTVYIVQYAYYRVGSVVFFDVYGGVTTVGTGNGSIILKVPSNLPISTPIMHSGSGTYGSLAIGLIMTPTPATFDRFNFVIAGGVGNIFTAPGAFHLSGWYITSAAV